MYLQYGAATAAVTDHVWMYVCKLDDAMRAGCGAGAGCALLCRFPLGELYSTYQVWTLWLVMDGRAASWVEEWRVGTCVEKQFSPCT